jgi:hypothetical protein
MLNPVLRLHLSWLVLAAGGLWGIAHNIEPGSKVASALLAGYIAWALYWGVPPFWRWWRRSGANLVRMSTLSPGGCLIQAVIAIFILFVGGYCFSVFGGGVYQFARCLRAAHYTT